MKVVLIIILVVIIMIIANAISEQYKEKFDFYANLKLFLNQFVINLNFKQEVVMNFLEKTKPQKQFLFFVNAYKKYLKTNELDLSVIKILSFEEKAELHDMILSIGKLDVTNETKQMEMFLLNIEEKLKKAENDKTKLCPMILKLSLLFSIALAILLL